MELKEAGITEIPVIRNLAHAIWPEAYGEIISADQIKYMLELMYSETALQEQMNKGHRFIIAEKDAIPVGFAGFSPKSDKEKNIIRLHKLYVLPRQHAQGTGSFLLNHVIASAKNAGADTIELNVNKYNTAKEFYHKKGFVVAREEVIDIGGGFVMDDYIMNLQIC